ncbi:MAG: DMT family transporter [Lentisphaeria bacterium]|nr:DMT family transporter [Lentisphaeria bacterium]
MYRSYKEKHASSTFKFFVYTHVIMGLICGIILPFIWTDKVPPFASFRWHLFFVCGTFLLGQLCMINALKSEDSSKISPLLSFKILILVCISLLFLGKSYSPGQYCAVAFCFGSGLLLNKISGELGFKAMMLTLGACLFFTLSDIAIPKFAKLVSDLPVIHNLFFTTIISYVCCGVLVLPFLFISGKGTKQLWKDAIPYSLTWLPAMLCLFASLIFLGPVYANIVQSSRGVIAILIGGLLATWGYTHLETKTSNTVLIKRVVAAIMISLAVIGFNLFQ